ncbi:hypothetical protein HPB52_016075 [Rhipicephalus sanguineus]|uniref:Uncharacterized protein n=1 Tax=Rhipicephalus sanguineus TaxID=34632 RepID=A0A9D4T159_RHISA|nr:hypothetical protein HPB52_003949 [Rhipicephalus sanguineus]KAH7962442.1 hypothetical protein HPB52_016075 [Rhipicephalus sanguineus]
MYYAYVRFIDDGKRHILPISDIKNFTPSHLKDFRPKKVYDVKWQDDVQDDFFGAQVVKLFDAENMASVADQDSNGAGTLSLGAAVASTPTRVLFEEIDGQN